MRKKSLVIVFSILCIMLLCISHGSSKNNGKKVIIVSDIPQVSDEMNIRFEQVFYKEIDNPTIEPLNLSFGGYETQGPPSCAFYQTSQDELGRIKGSFYFIKPPYSHLALGLDGMVVRGIYDIEYEIKNGYYNYSSFILQVEELDAVLRDLKLTCKLPSFLPQNQVIPLDYVGGCYMANFESVQDITTNDLYNCPLVLTGVLEYQGEDYPFQAKF
ncbi:MAG: hypothetical protein IJ411_00210 [Oscillospiraceae bacterium]|nr:hypothetical protein [Oscillospiraceae bacterium]